VVSPFEGKITEEVGKRKLPFHVIPFLTEIYEPHARPGLLKKVAKFAYNWYTVVRYAKVLKSRKKTIIHTNASVTLIGAYLSFWLRVPHVWHIREFAWEHYQYRYNFGERYFNYWLNKAAAVLAISNAIYEKRVKDCKAPEKRIIYNGVIFSRQLKLKQNLDRPDNRDGNIILGIIGLICEKKGQLEAIKALKQLSATHDNTELVVAGESADDYAARLQEKVRDDGLEKKVHFPGFIENPECFYEKIDILLMCSRNEGLGRVTIEAMSHGIPVIGYDSGGTKEIIEHGYNGLLYTGGATELGAMVRKLIEDAELMRRLRRNALRTVEDKFTIEAYTGNVLDVYQRCISAGISPKG
jgi:glycosyltransferase involved in cell wall biosynthesis